MPGEPAAAVTAIMGARAAAMPGGEAAAAGPGSCSFLLSQVRDPIGPLNQWPAGHLIMALSKGPSLERMMNRYLTSVGLCGSKNVSVTSSAT